MALTLAKYSIGIGDRFGKQGAAQLKALIQAREQGIDITPVWNKSAREHQIIGTDPKDARIEADEAVKQTGWTGQYFVDADHINPTNVGIFVEPSDFFTLDVAEAIGKPVSDEKAAAFISRYESLIGAIEIPGIDRPLEITRDLLKKIADSYLSAVEEAASTYEYLVDKKGEGNFVTEVSMDETASPQTPLEMLFILAELGRLGVPAQTIAPKFTGEFHKGVDYVGDVPQFTVEFREDIAVIAYAVEKYGLPGNLKLSVHSGSDKFSIYGPINQALKDFDAGVHLKTAGTTWLEEIIGLADAGEDGLTMAKEVYAAAYTRREELMQPYEAVIDIDDANLPSPEDVNAWSREKYLAVLRHDQSNPEYDVEFRQMVHIGFKVAAEMGERYFDALDKYAESVSKNVTYNIFERHIKPVFIG